MRRAPDPIEPPPTPHVDLAERLRATADRLVRMPSDLVGSLSVTTGSQGRDEADVRALATAAAAAAGLAWTIESHGDVVTVRFLRSTQAAERAD